ncbi:MAG: D-isomer specific 2-hydroxyacid dehydrogenase family protein [Solirubrobacteraceae bacterium]
MSPRERPAVHVGPTPEESLLDAVRAGGGEPAALDEADALVWTGHNPQELPRPLPDRVRWVQLPSAGVESWIAAGVVDRARIFTSAAGAYARSVAEHALALVLGGARRLPEAARATRWGAPPGAGLAGRTVAVVGAGGIGRELIAMLGPLDVEILAVTRRGRAVPGADVTLAADRTGEVWPAADFVVIAAPATAGTRHLVGREQLTAMRSGAWLVNVARGSLVDTDSLTEALADGRLGGAALDVTDPEPLPDDHPLWREPRALITPHAANPPAALEPAFDERVRENVARFAAGADLLGRIDPDAGY